MPAADLDLTDATLQAAMANDIAELRSRFPETRALYREVCGLLFFRYGVTPTTNKLYSLVRKGSMGTPAEVLQAFWQELRGRTRVTIDHPDLPDALKDIAAGAVQTIWQAANEAATGELATLRAEARHAASAAEAERDAARTETAAAREEVAAISAQLAEAREAHAATQARLEAGRAELDAAGRQLAELRTQFSTELERAREQVTLAQERAEASERRSLREPDAGRTARQQSERTAEALRGELLAARSEARDAAVAQAEVRARLAAAEEAQRKSAHDLDAVQAELGTAQRRAERAEAEAALARQLLAELRACARNPRSTEESILTARPSEIASPQTRPAQMIITRHMRRHHPDRASRRVTRPSAFD
ncbi:DNA-binding protein [Cupriavidus necator]|uniref:DNA-binding protein n=1 Tax=Cupriavidus necator TaxID=106590 RepID=UPI000308E203|nr:DNA-binding protein [Cupriavidus necator]MDX6007213.1 DNA-binding protein [Cupriavidus necator]